MKIQISIHVLIFVAVTFLNKSLNYRYTYRFYMVFENGEIIAKSSEGYVSAQGRENAIGVVKREAALSSTVDLT